MHPSRPELPRCANCGVEIPWRPSLHRGETYCCGGCAQGGPCYCSYDLTERTLQSVHPLQNLATQVPVQDFAREVR